MNRILINNNDYQLSTFYNILDAIPVSIYWKDLSGRYLGCNKYMVDMAGPDLTRSDIVGKTDKEFVWGDIAGELSQIDSFVIKSGAKYEVEESPVIAGAQRRTYLSTKSPLYDDTGKIIGLIGISIDITDRKNAEKFQKEKEIADRISRTMEMLSGSIAHEVRTPLSGININIDNLHIKLKKSLRDSVTEKDKKEIMTFIENIKFAVTRSSNIISMLLVKIRSILGHKASEIACERELRITSIKSDISKAIKEYPFFGKENELVTWNEEDNVDFKYKGSSLLTKHMLFNLIKNALKIIKEVDKGKIYISLKSDKEFNYLIFKDTASGIAPEILEFLFQQFGSKDGTGLGLIFCKMTMQSYNGDITCDSKEGKYTQFTLSFPAL